MFFALLALSACSPQPQGLPWYEQLHAEGPCWDVNLADGLDEASTDEIHSLYGCLNQSGNFDAFGELDEAFDAQSRDGRPIGIELALLVNGLASQELDIFGLSGGLLELLTGDDRPVEPMLEMFVELSYGRPYAQVVSEVELASGSALDQGVLAPLIPVLSTTARAILDDGPAVPRALADALRADGDGALLCTTIGLVESSDPELVALGEDLVPDLGAAIGQARQTGNDRWTGASGDSLRDIVETLLLENGADGDTALQAMADDALVILQTERTRDNLRVALEESEAGGHLDAMPPQLLYMASVDVNGGSLAVGEDSALLSLLRLLHDGNQGVECTIDLWITEIPVDLGNLSVEILRTMARMDPANAAGSVDIMGDVLGWGLTDALLEQLADSGICPVIDPQFVSDLNAIDRFNDPQTGDLLVVLLQTLAAFYDGGNEDRTPELVNLLALAYGRGLVPPVEEVLRDLASSALVRDATDLIPLLLDPSPLDTRSCPAGSEPLTFEGAWDKGLSALTPDGSGDTALQVWEPVTFSVLGHDGTWQAVGNFGELATHEDATLQELPQIALQLVQAAPAESTLQEDLADMLEDPTLYGPALRIVESREVQEALSGTELTAEGPLPWLNRMILGDTLPTLLRTMDLLLGSLRG